MIKSMVLDHTFTMNLCFFHTVHPYHAVFMWLTFRYFEGQLTSISETDDEDDVDKPPVSIVQAAEKVKSLVHVLYHFILFKKW